MKKIYLKIYLIILSFVLIILYSCAEQNDSGVIVGRDGWLFDADTVSNYRNDGLFNDEELNQIKDALVGKSEYYKENGAEFVLMLVPDAVSVYSEYLPKNIKKPAETRLEQVIEYLEENTDILIVNPYDSLVSNKDVRQTYENTGITWNTYGAFLGYTALIESISPLFDKGLYVRKEESYTFNEEKGEGLELAVTLEDIEKYQNNNVIMSLKDFVMGKPRESYSDKIRLTYIPSDNLILRYSQANIMMFGDEYLQSMEQFVADTFKEAAFIKNYNNQNALMMQIKPSVVVFEFAEKNLKTLLSLGDTLMLNESKTSAPTLIDKTFLSSDRYCIAGRGEEGAVISVIGAASPATAVVTEDGQYIVEFFIDKSIKDDIQIYLYANKDGKDESDPLMVTIERSEKRTDKPVAVGKENHIHYSETFPDYLGNSLYSDQELERIKRKFESLQQQLNDAGCNTKVILFVAPNHSTIYPETMPDFLRDQKVSDNSRLFQLTDYMKDSTIKFITPYDSLMEAKKTDLVYNRTDTHWNDYGAYIGYKDIFDYISIDFPEAKPLPLDYFNKYRVMVNGGDIIPMLKFNQNEYKENANNIKIKEQTTIIFNTDEILYQEGWYHQFREYDRKDPSKPNILMYRDSFSISTMSFISETANKTTFYGMWDYNIDVDYIKSINPDYVIIERVERSIGDLPYMLR